MKRDRRNILRMVLLSLPLVATSCDREQSVASKSAAAYRDAQAKGTTVAAGHDHSAHGSTETAAGIDHSAHGTMPAGEALDHSAHGTGGSAAANHHAAAGDPAGHDAHRGTSAAGHAAMGHGSATGAHATHGSASHVAATDHIAMGHGSTRPADAHAGHTSAAEDQHAQHGSTSTATTSHAQDGATSPAAPADHTGHGASHAPTTSAASAHAQHGAPSMQTPALPPASNSGIQHLQPGAGLRQDSFDAPASTSVAEAAKATQGGGHEGHAMQGITPGEDHENPPAPMPATRDGSQRAPAADHSQHGTARPAASPDATTIYACPMHPEVTSSEPGKCPKCGMALVKKSG